jgi:hypothetical protein
MSESPPLWSPPLAQDTPNGPVYFMNEANIRFNIYSLSYQTTYTLQDGTYTIGSGSRETDVSSAIINLRSTMIGVVPLIKITSTNQVTPILYSFPANNQSISIVALEKDYSVIPQEGVNGLYGPLGASQIRLPYRNALIINGVYDSSGGYSPSLSSITIPMEIKQMDSHGFTTKTINLPVTITRVNTTIAMKSFDDSAGAYNISDPRNQTQKYAIVNGAPSQTLTADFTNGVITLEYLNVFYDLSFAEFAATDRRNVTNGAVDYTNAVYYVTKRDGNVYDVSNDYIEINDTRIIIKKVTYNANNGYDSIPIKFYQAATPVYNKSNREIGELVYENGRTIRLKILKSTPRFEGQTPTQNNSNPATIYTLPDVNKMTTEGSFVITPPLSNNTDASDNFVISSSNESVVKIVLANGVFTGRVYLDGVTTITVTQLESTNFNRKTAIFNINVFKITPAIINCNTNVFYTNPYNRQFWTRFTPTCRNADLYDSVTNVKLTPDQVNQVYDMRRKAEILKYSKNVGGLTKSQKYAKASRGELMRKIGNENKYLSQSTGAGGSGGAGPFTLICPSTPASRSRLQCGLTTACGVPGKERILCYDPSVNLYNYKKTYEYNAGLQITYNIPTTALTAPTNLVVSDFDVTNNRITLKWDAPDSNGGFPITGYVITYSVDNKTWAPYTSILPNGPKTGDTARYNPISGELNGNSVVFEKKEGSVPILTNTVYYLSVFSGNERGLSSVPATITFKTSSVPTMITNFSFSDSDERKNRMIDVKWRDPSNLGTANVGGYNGPAITSYNLYYKETTATMWNKLTIDTTTVITSASSASEKRYILRNVENEKRYSLKIEPINSVGVGPESAILTARTLMKPMAPLNVVASARYGLSPPSMVDLSRNYIVVNWSKPDDGGNRIRYYNITVTNVGGTGGASQTFTYNILSTNQDTTFTSSITRMTTGVSSGYIVDGTYSVVVAAYNGYLTSESSTVSNVVILPTSAKPAISDMVGYYSQFGLEYAQLIFTINNGIAPGIVITNIRVNGLNVAYSTRVNIYGQDVNGTGEHIIRVPSSFSGDEVIIVGNRYNVTLTITYSSGVESTSELFVYTPEIRYITAA